MATILDRRSVWNNQHDFREVRRAERASAEEERYRRQHPVISMIKRIKPPVLMFKDDTDVVVNQNKPCPIEQREPEAHPNTPTVKAAQSRPDPTKDPVWLAWRNSVLK